MSRTRTLFWYALPWVVLGLILALLPSLALADSVQDAQDKSAAASSGMAKLMKALVVGALPALLGFAIISGIMEQRNGGGGPIGAAMIGIWHTGFGVFLLVIVLVISAAVALAVGAGSVTYS